MPRSFTRGPPLKLPGLLELRSKPWNTTFPDAFIRGLSTDDTRAGGADAAVSVLRVALLPVLVAGVGSDLGFETLILGGLRLREIGAWVGFSESREIRGSSS